MRLRWRPTFARGVHPPDFKSGTAGSPVRRLAFPERVYLQLDRHAGQPAQPVVRPGQEVLRGEVVAEPGGPVSVPIHASVTGVVERLVEVPTVRGPKSWAVVVRTHAGASQEAAPLGPPRDPERLGGPAIVRAVRASGLVGLGGAAFPTYVKLSPAARNTIDTLVVNGCECEPYLTADHRVMLEEGADLAIGLRLAMRALGVTRAVVGVEDDKRDAARALAAALAGVPGAGVELVATKYPQGAEKMLVKALLGREIPRGGLPAHVGVALQNVGTLAQLGRLVPRNEGLVERVVTVSGPAVARPGNYRVALGTPLAFVLEQAGAPALPGMVILGGAMMGHAVPSLEVPVNPGTNGVLAFAGDPAATKAPYHCIRCGRCVAACPMGLEPAELGLLARAREYARMAAEHHLLDCVECGSCAYVCPAGIPLVQYMRIAKSIHRERQRRAA